MKHKFLILILAVIAIISLSGCGQKQVPAAQNEAQAPADDTAMVNCGKMEDPSCFMTRMNACLPVTAEMTGSDGTTKIEMIILGQENETCHFQRKINNALDLNCFFPRGTMNWDTIDQTFGNDKGLQKVVDDACKTGW